jgi:hypothetical protein
MRAAQQIDRLVNTLGTFHATRKTKRQLLNRLQVKKGQLPFSLFYF